MRGYRPELCVISSVEATGVVKLDCLAALAGPVIHTTASSVAEADQMLWLTYCTFAGIVMILPLLLVIPALLRALGRSRINKKVQAKMELFGSLPLDPDLEGLFPPHMEDYH